ncbi:MAG: dihydroneopterin aldolase [Alphaproteobacteria bacterium]|nr:dihydroneopterin aldolase [Alphaproteobacteria bacterium]
MNFPERQSPTGTRTLRRILIRDLELSVQIGIHGHEHGRAQPVRINLDLAVDDSPVDDRLEAVVDYEAIVGNVRAITEQGHINLAETLAERIAQVCLDDPRVKIARVRVEKLHAVPGAESAGVEIERRRGAN